MASYNFVGILETLAKHNVGFVLVGGVAAVAHGVEMLTFDVDIVHSRSAENIPGVLAALRELNASNLDECLPDQLIMTKYGQLDLQGTIDDGLGYNDIVPHSDIVELSPGVRILVLGLEKLREFRQRRGRDKDLAVLPQMRATIAELKKREIVFQ